MDASFRKFVWAVLVIFLQSFCACALELGYLESVCGTSKTFTTSFQLDSSTGITYKNLLDCNYTVTAPGSHYVLALITRFEVEAAFSGTCNDYLDVYDGVDTSAAKLHTDLLCGSGSSIPRNFTSTGQSMTLQFVTDSSGSYLGFNIVFAAITYTPCSTSQYACNNSVCIDATLACDNYDQCGDSSDEDNCDGSVASGGVDIVMIVVIVLSVVAVIACVVAYIAYRVHEKNKWKKFVNSRIDDDDGLTEPKPSYPVTYKYYKGVRGHPAYYVNSGAGEGISSENSFEKRKDEASELQPSTSSVLS